LNCGNFECGVVEKGGGELVCQEEDEDVWLRDLVLGVNGSGYVGWGKR